MNRLILATTLSSLATPGFALDCPEGQRPFTHAAGEDCIPVDPQRIVTLQDQNGLLPLLELEVRPIGSAGHVQEDGTQTFRRTEGYDTAGIAFVGTYGQPDREAVAALEPDLIIASPWPEGAYELYSPIAPTIVIDMFDQALEDALFQFADAVNRTDKAGELKAEFDARAAEVREALGEDFDRTTISVVAGEYEGSGFYGFEPTQAWGMIRRALDPVMTPPERDWSTNRDVKSMEALGEHAADVMFLMAFDADEGGNSDEYASFVAQPLVQALDVHKAGQLLPLDGSRMVGSAWGKAMNGLDQISAVLLREDLNRDLVQE